MGSGVVVVIVVLILRRVSRLVSNRETSGQIVSWRGAPRDAHWTRGAPNRRADGHARWQGPMGRVEACLNEVLALGLGDEGLELGGGEGVYKACLRDDEEQNLCTSEGRQLVCLFHNASFPFGERYMTSRFILDELNLDLPASCLLVGLGLVLFLVVVAGTVDGVMVVDEGVLNDGAALDWVVCWYTAMHVESPLPLAHRRRGGGGIVGLSEGRRFGGEW